jgi:hypothetical protein
MMLPLFSGSHVGKAPFFNATASGTKLEGEVTLLKTACVRGYCLRGAAVLVNV